jgi:hypothetical protein
MFLGRRLLLLGYEMRFTALVVLALFWAPVLAGLHSNNVSIIVVGLLLLLTSGYVPVGSWAFAAMLGLALAVKPQLGVLYLLYLAARDRWSPLWRTLLVVGVVTAVGLGWFWIVEPNWLADYRQEQVEFNAPGEWGDVTYGSPNRYVLLNLQVAIYPWILSVAASRVLGALVAAALAVLWFVIDRKARARPNELLALASLIPISLLGVFQQFYNGALFVLCLAATLTLRRSRGMWIVLVILCLFVVRPAVIFKQLPLRFLNGGVHSVLWNSFGVGFSAWLAFATCISMLWLYWRWSRGEEHAVEGL